MAACAVARARARRAGTGDLRRAGGEGGRTEAPSTRIGDFPLAARGAGTPPRGVRIRPETEEDRAAIWKVNEEAFGRSVEADLVDAIRSSDRFVPELSLVATVEEEV